MKMLKSKNIRRICVLLAMLAPVVYLFGSLFSALTGAHGTEVFAQESEPTYIDYDSSYLTTGYYSYVDGTYYSDARFRNTGIVACSGSVLLTFGGSVGADSQRYLVFYDSNRAFLSGEKVTSSACLNAAVVPDGVSYFSASFYWLNVNWSDPSVSVVYSAENYSYSDYVFSQFFAKDNFLEQIGKDVLSDNPHGFVPFASFWKYLDENMLHMGNMQLGLMGYGYVYYACHVLLFDIAFILVTFFLDFIQKVNDKIVGGVD